MPSTVRDLLGSPALALTLLLPEGDLPPGALDAPVTWVHSSDLPDPTPFLEPGHVLLTGGSQLTAAPDIAAYVDRLAQHGVAALGFGSGLVVPGPPPEIVDACRTAGLPLFEVPYRIPFIAIAQAAAAAAAEEANARRNWALKAQRAISLAALKPNGLAATLAEASRQLDRWVVLIDAGGGLDRAHPIDPGEDVLAAVREQATALLRRRRRGSASVETDGQHVLLQTLGSGQTLRGVLAVGGAARLDDAGQQVLDGVVAMAALALEASHELDRARALLRTGLWHALLAGEVALVAEVAAQVWSPLPAGPVRVAVTRPPAAAADAVAELLEARAADRPGSLFFAAQPSGVALAYTDANADLPALVADTFDVAVGVSNPVGLDALRRGTEQAEEALERTRPAVRRVVTFADLTRDGVLALLTRLDVSRVAEAVLDPLLQHDAEQDGALVPTLRAWLEHDGHAERAAAVLGIHRHTLRARIQTCSRLLGRDLDEFAARADVWAGLLALDAAVRPVPERSAAG